MIDIVEYIPTMANHWLQC